MCVNKTRIQLNMTFSIKTKMLKFKHDCTHKRHAPWFDRMVGCLIGYLVVNVLAKLSDRLLPQLVTCLVRGLDDCLVGH